MATVTKPIALDESLNTTELSSRNVADVLAQELSAVATAIGGISAPSAEDVSYDNSGSGLSATDVQNALDEIVSDIPTVNDGTLTIQQNGETKGTFTANQSGNSTVNIEIPTTDIQTAVDEFSTYNGGLLSSLKVSLSPNQDLHGYDEPWVGGAGKNKLQVTMSSTTSQDITATVYDDGTVLVNGTSTGTCILTLNNTLALNGNYILSGCPSGGDAGTFRMDCYWTGQGALIDSGNGVAISPNGNTITTRIIIMQGVTVNNQLFKPMIRLATESDPTFEPYSNICPISGHTQVEVDVSDGQTTQEQVTVNLGGTYYSGTLDVVSGVFVPDTAEKDLSTLTFRSASQNRWLSEGIKSEVKHPSDSSTKIKFWSDSYYYTDAVTLYFNASLIGIAVDNEGNLLCRNNDTNPPTGHIVYELATPTPIQLSPTMVKALVGENHLSAPLEGQEITESKYKQMFTFDDVIAYIQSL